MRQDVFFNFVDWQWFAVGSDLHLLYLIKCHVMELFKIRYLLFFGRNIVQKLLWELDWNLILFVFSLVRYFGCTPLLFNLGELLNLLIRCYIIIVRLEFIFLLSHDSSNVAKDVIFFVAWTMSCLVIVLRTSRIVLLRKTTSALLCLQFCRFCQYTSVKASRLLVNNLVLKR